MTDPVDQLVERLVADAAPVRPLPSLRRIVVSLLGVWVVVAATGVAILGLRPDLVPFLLSSFGTAGVYLGLGAAGVGGICAAVASAIPGREPATRFALGVSIGGLAGAAGFGTLLVLESPLLEARMPAAHDWSCLLVALAVAALPAIGVILVARRAAPFRPLVLSLAAAAGTAALGSIAAQASCAAGDPVHLLLGHVLAPAAGVLVLTLPLLAALRRLRVRSETAI